MKTYNVGIINTSKKKMVGSELKKEIKDLRIHLNELQKEIEFWFSLLLKNSNPQHRNYLRKPVCISLFEYVRYLQWIKNDIKIVSKKVNEMFSSKGRPTPLKPLEGKFTKTLEDIKGYLKNPRNRIAAHRYTTKNNKEFIGLDEFISLTNKLSFEKLEKMKDRLYTCNELISSWLDKNKNYLVLINK